MTGKQPASQQIPFYSTFRRIHNPYKKRLFALFHFYLSSPYQVTNRTDMTSSMSCLEIWEHCVSKSTLKGIPNRVALLGTVGKACNVAGVFPLEDNKACTARTHARKHTPQHTQNDSQHKSGLNSYEMEYINFPFWTTCEVLTWNHWFSLLNCCLITATWTAEIVYPRMVETVNNEVERCETTFVV